jgi:hypothetical protein
MLGASFYRALRIAFKLILSRWGTIAMIKLSLC